MKRAIGSIAGILPILVIGCAPGNISAHVKNARASAPLPELLPARLSANRVQES